MAAQTSELCFILNGKLVVVDNPDPQQLLVHYLRQSGHTGTKFVCGQGGCGACTVNIRPWKTKPPVKFIAVNGCLRPLAAVHEMEVLTVEGLGRYNPPNEKMDEVQKKIAEYNGSQCGYCTPGFVMGMNAYLSQTQADPPDLVDIENIFDGHLCRCTGYRPILCAMKTFGKGGNQEELKHTPPLIVDPNMAYSLEKTQHPNVAVVSSKVAAAPKIALDIEETDGPTILVCKKGKYIWYGLRTLDQLWYYLQKYKSQRQSVRLVTANTAYGIQPYQPYIKEQNIMLFIGRIPDLTVYSNSHETITARCAVPIQQLRDMMESLSKAYKGTDLRTSYPPTIAYNHWKRLATTEVRNVGSVAGNLFLVKKKQFPSDLFIVLATLGAKVTVASKPLKVLTTKDYSMIDFLKDHQVTLDGTNIIYEVKIPIKPKKDVFIYTYKVSQRPQNSHPLVNAGFSIKVTAHKFEEVKIFFGIHGREPREMTNTEKWMMENCTHTNLLDKLSELFTTLKTELDHFVKKNPKYSKSSRTETACNIFFKYLVKMAAAFQFPQWSDIKRLSSAPESLVNQRFTVTSSGQQDFCVYRKEYPVSEPIIKQSAFLQATGEAKFVQDTARLSHHLHGVYILNMGTKAQAYANFKIKYIQSTFEQKFSDVVRVFTAEDIGTVCDLKKENNVYPRNNMGSGQPGFPGDTIFAEEEVSYIGQPIGMVVAAKQATARDAAEWLMENAVTYTSKSGGQGPIYTLGDAINKNSFFYDSSTHQGSPDRLTKVSRPKTLTEIDWDKYEKDSSMVVVEGSQKAASQYHFYMETQSAIAFPTEQGGMRVVVSTQSPDDVQSKVAKACLLPMNKVTLEINRIGGGYGGKEVQSKFTAAAAAFCAQQLMQPVRVANYRVEDMQMIGKRHDFIGNYKLAASKTDGKLKAVKIDFFSNGGCTYDATFPVMDLCLLSSDNAYNAENFLVTGQCARTNKASNTAFRSFGVVQTMTIVEAAMEALAEKLNKPGDVIREKNFYKQNDDTPYGQKLMYCNLQGVWDTVKNSSNYEQRKLAVQKFNQSNIFKKQGIKLMPLKYGISFTRKQSNKGSAIVSVYSRDGTVLLSHGGVEMGQGLNTKMMQIAALELNIPLDYITIHENSTDKIANAVSTGASTGSDLNGGAVKDACNKLRLSLEDNLKKNDPDSEAMKFWEKHRKWYIPGDNGKNYWKYVITLAGQKRVALTSYGHFKSPNLTMESPFYYFNYATAVSEVEIDALTGEFTILRADIVYDAGHSLNPAIDIGQIEGGFVMGVGNVTTEELDYDAAGRLLTDGTWEYKPPCTKTIPRDLRVTLYPGAHHDKLKHPIDRVCHLSSTVENLVKIDPHGIQSSKTTGEPPLVLANSVFFAIRDAVIEARKEVGLTGPFQFDSPATVQRIQTTCGYTAERIAKLVHK